MEKVLTQEEIDALFRAASRGSASLEPQHEPSRVEPWNLNDAGRLRREQLHSISQLHESFARNLSHSLGANLRNKFEVTLVSVEQLTYREFTARMPDSAYYSTFLLDPAQCNGVLQLDLSLACPIVDLLLGGEGLPGKSRQASEIEVLVLEGVGQVICRELHATWSGLGLGVAFQASQAGSQTMRIMPAQEKTLSLSFEVAMPASRGMLNICFPAVVSRALLRKLSAEWVYQRPSGVAIQQEVVKRRLLDSEVDLELCTAPVGVRLHRLLDVQPGSVLAFRQRIDQPARLRLAGRELWSARPVQSADGARAAQLLARAAEREEQEL